MRRAALMACIAVCASGCSTRPREFRPTLASPTTDQSKFDETLLQCQVMVRRGVKGNFATTAAQLGAGSAGGIAASALAASAFSGATTSGFVNGAAITAGGSALLVVGPLAGFGVSRLIRTSREKKYKAALGTCLSEFGYSAQGWDKQKKLSKEQVNAVIEKWKTASTPSTDPPLIPSDAID